MIKGAADPWQGGGHCGLEGPLRRKRKKEMVLFRNQRKMKRKAAGTERGEAVRGIEGCLKGSLKGRTGRESDAAKDRQMKMRRETTDGRKTTNRSTKQAAVTCRLLLRF